MPTDEAPEPTRDIPYVGPTPFRREDKDLFFGRSHESDELLSLVTAHPVVLLYSQSGAGKTSLLNASLIPTLEREGFDVVGPARVRSKAGEGFDFGGANPYVFNALAFLSGDNTVPALAGGLTLEAYLKWRLRTDEDGHLVRPCVLIFDQFEELFTLSPEFWEHRRGFFEQVAQALTDPLLRVLFAMREDFIAELDPYELLLPEELRTRLRLERLREQAAREAITEPLRVEPWKKLGRKFAPGVAEKLVSNLREIPSKTGLRGRPVLGEFVEPVQLQIVCESIWRGLGEGETRITESHLEKFGNINESLTAFYEACVREAVEEANVKARERGERELREGELRAWFENKLIKETGKRGVVFRGGRTTEGIPNAAVDALERKHLIKPELRDGDRWYELSHDRFIQPIKDSYKKWLLALPGAERTLLRLEERAAAWYEKKDPLLLLSVVETPEVRTWLDGPEMSSLSASPRLDAYVNASEAARERAERETERRLAAERAKVAETERLRAEELSAARQREAEQALALAAEQRKVAEAERERAEEKAQANTLLRRAAAGLGLMFLLAVGLSMYAYSARSEAVRQRAEAVTSAGLAREEAERANAEKQKADEQTLLAREKEAEATEAKQASEAARAKAEASAREARRQGELARAETRRANEQRLAAERVRRLSDLQARTDRLYREGTDLYLRGEYSSAARTLSETLELYALARDDRGQASTLLNIGAVYNSLGEQRKALDYYTQAFSLYREIDDRSSAARALNSIGELYTSLGDTERARESLGRALAYYREAGNHTGEAQTLNSLSTLARERGDHAEARAYLERALLLYERLNDPGGQAATFMNLGSLYEPGEKQQALDYYTRALAIFEGTDNILSEAQTLNKLGALYDSIGDKEKARAHYQRANELLLKGRP